MNVGSYLELYTTMFGWSFYNMLYELFNLTGILYLPFLMAIYKNWRDPYLSQDEKSAAVTSQQRMTWGMISLILVFTLAILPVTPLALNELRYRVACTDAGGGQLVGTDVQGGNTGKTYDTAMAGDDTRIPFIWWLTLGISSGLNYAVTSSFKCFEDIKGLDQQLRNLTLGDEVLRAEYGRFANECFLPAKTKYLQALRGGERQAYVVNAEAAWLGGGNETVDLHFIGSHFYLETDGFYKAFDVTNNCRATASGCGFRANKPVPGWPYVEDRDNYGEADLDAGTAGRPFCDEWWEGFGVVPGLEAKLLSSVEAAKIVSDGWDDTKTSFQNIKNMISDTYTGVVYTDEEIEDLVIKRYVTSDPPVLTGKWDKPESNDLGNNLVAGTAAAAYFFPAAAVATAVAVVPAALATGVEIAKTFGGFYTAMFVIKTAAPMLQAVLLMMIYALLLIYLVVSEYDVDSVITAIFLILAVRFFTSLWAVADYLDAQMFIAMFPDATWLGSDITFALERLLLDMVLTVLYVVAPILLLYLMQMAGQNISRIGAGGMDAGDIKGTGKGVGGSGRLK